MDDPVAPIVVDPAQQALFALPEPDPRNLRGYRGPVAAGAARITYRQLDHWARTRLVVPSIQHAHGSGTNRLYSLRDILVLQVVKRLLETGVSLASIRRAVTTLTGRGIADLAGITLISDGITVFACTNDDEVIDLVNGGQGVFGIAIGSVMADVKGFLTDVPDESALVDPALVGPEPPAPGSSGMRTRHLRSVG